MAGPRQKITDAQLANIKKLRELGYSLTKIAKLTRVSRATVYYRINPEFRKNHIERVSKRMQAKRLLAKCQQNSKQTSWATE